MTTIAYRDGIIAADTRLVIGETKLYCRKIHQIDELVLAIAGRTNSEGEVIEYYRGESKKKPGSLKQFEAFKVEDGEILWANGDLYWQPLPHSYYALGSGWQVAMAGMILGLSAVEAVQLAADLDINTNKLVDIYDIRTQQFTLVPFPYEKTEAPTRRKKNAARV